MDEMNEDKAKDKEVDNKINELKKQEEFQKYYQEEVDKLIKKTFIIMGIGIVIFIGMFFIQFLLLPLAIKDPKYANIFFTIMQLGIAIIGLLIGYVSIFPFIKKILSKAKEEGIKPKITIGIGKGRIGDKRDLP